MGKEKLDGSLLPVVDLIKADLLVVVPNVLLNAGEWKLIMI
jgi:hypothetical protein